MAETPRPIRILVAGGYRMHSALLGEYLNQHVDLEVVGTAESVEDARAALAESRPDVLVLHQVLHTGGEDLVMGHVPSSLRLPTVLVCGSCAEERWWNRRRSRKDQVAVSACRTPDSILQAVRALHSGNGETPRTAEHVDCPPEAFRRSRGLTKTELVVFSMIAGGLTNRAVAKRLGISIRTVENHRLQLRKKLSVRDTAELIREAAKIGLLR